MTEVSVAIGTQDEADRLPRALSSVQWADEVVVVDCGSSDRTVEIARQSGAIVTEIPTWPGDGPQKKASIDAARGPWVLVLDADEEVSPGLGQEIRAAVGRADPPNGFEILFHTRHHDHWFGRRGWYRERHLRLVRKDVATVSDRTIHSSLSVSGRLERLRQPIRHYSDRNLSHHVAKLQKYSSIKARDLDARDRATTLTRAFAYAVGAFLADYLRRGRFLDGAPGLAYSAMGAHATLQAYVRLWELRNRPATSSPGPSVHPATPSRTS